MADLIVPSQLTTYANDNANDADQIQAEYEAIYTALSDAYTRINLVYGVSGTTNSKLDGKKLILRNSFTSTPDSADRITIEVERGLLDNVGLRWNEDTDKWEATFDGTTWYEIITFAELGGSINSAVPKYASASSYTIASFNVTNNDATGYITATSTKTADLSSAGAAGGVAQSDNLDGTITTTSGSTTITGSGTDFSTDFIVGDVITSSGGTARRITAINSATDITVASNWGANETGVTYKRGGEAPSTHYHLYAIGSPAALLWSTRNVAGGNTMVDLPSGYTSYKQLKFSVQNNSSSNIIPQSVAAGWPQQPTIIYDVSTSYYNGSSFTNGTNAVLTGGTSASFATLSLGSYVPPTSRSVIMHALAATGPYVGAVRATSSSIVVACSPAAGGGNLFLAPMSCSSGQQIDYIKYGGTGSLYLDVYGYIVTEV